MAPLKLIEGYSEANQPISFPRSFERGPIEALPFCRSFQPIYRAFPRSFERGPIEALQIWLKPKVAS